MKMFFPFPEFNAAIRNGVCTGIGMTFLLLAISVTDGFGQCPNLITNPGFESGNTGFSSQFTYQSDLTPANTYYVGYDAHSYHPSFSGVAHSGSNMMIANGTDNNNSWAIVYQTDIINLTPNATYYFSWWCREVFDSGDPQLLVYINDVHVYTFSFGFAWSNFAFSWTAPAGITSANIKIREYSVGSNNDYALDDLSFERAPTQVNCYTNSNCWITDGLHDYTITVVSDDQDGIGGNPSYWGHMALVNLYGSNAGNYGGYFSWSPWHYCQIKNQMAATGGGYASMQGDSYGYDVIDLVGCSTSLNGTTRTTVFTVRPKSNFPAAVAINDISTYAMDGCGNIANWYTWDLNFSSGNNAGYKSGTASASQTICSGSQPANIILSGYTGSIQWQSSSDNVTWTDIQGATSPTLTGAQMGTITATKCYHAVVSGICGSITSNTVNVSVGLTPIITISGASNICKGSTTNYSATRTHIYTGGTSFFSFGASSSVEVLVVAGGGGGGMDMGGGGGGGGVIYNPSYAGSGTVNVSVGDGGRGGPAGSTNEQPGGHQFTISATKGGNSVFGSLTAIGGGYGGSSYFGYTPNNGYGGSGGSGGGASGYSDGNTGRYGAGTSGQGYRGGSNGGQYYSGGGGGASGAGADGTNQANGGPGVLCAILGTNYYWGGGGGGAGYSIGGGNGGIGGGGGGAVGTTTGGAGYKNGQPGTYGCTVCWAQVPGGNGGANTGGGGGGGSHYNLNNKGGDGGSGIVIVKAQTAGTWSSSNPAVASVDPATGVVTAVSGGTVTIINTFTSQGCTSVASKEITVMAPIATVSSQSNISCYAGNNGSFTITASGGTGPYTFSKNNGETYVAGDTGTQKTFTGLSAGTYYLRVKDITGCESPSCP
jgi:hypothetical protein